MINVKILKAMYDEAEDYIVNGIQVKRIFETPAKIYFDVDTLATGNITGTEDINWCQKIIKNNIFEKAGYPEYQKKEHPFLVDTSIFCRHIDWDGQQYPINGEEFRFLPEGITGNPNDFILKLKNRFNMLNKDKE